jgi:hypothetical protein
VEPARVLGLVIALNDGIVLRDQAAQPHVRGRLAVGQMVHDVPGGPAPIGRRMVQLGVGDAVERGLDGGVSASELIEKRGTIHGAKDTGPAWQTAGMTTDVPEPGPDAASLPFEGLDFVYMPSQDVATDMRYFTDTLGAHLVFAVDGMGARVAMIELTPDPPRILLADHLEGDRPILVYRVADFQAALKALKARGWKRGHSIEIPHGPLCSFITPGGQRLAIYELARPQVEEHFAGRVDF